VLERRAGDPIRALAHLSLATIAASAALADLAAQ